MAGRLIYLMGPSGAGKDSVLDAARGVLDARGCKVVRRVITRSAEAVGEDAIAVSPEAFTARLQSGDFAMSWQANGLWYGIPKEVDVWLSAGHQVLVNGSRGYWEEARQRYPQMLAILLEVDPDVLRSRLLCRGRETLDEIEARLARNARFAGGGRGAIVLDNSGPIEQTVARLVQLIDTPIQLPE